MTRSNAYWLAAVLAVTPFVAYACGGDDSSPTGGTGGAGGSTGGAGGATGGAGGATGGAGGSTGGATSGGAAGTGGSAGSAGSAGSKDGGFGPADAGMLADGRPTCGANNCSTNPTGTNICDTATGRCVDCLTDNDCAIETTAKRCDTSLATTGSQAGLPRYACEECLDNSHCPAGATCVGGDCQTPCGTAMCETGEICDAPNNRCIECLSDANCANNPGNTRCNLAPNSAGLPTGNCEECIDSTHCPTGQVCFDNNCEPACATDADCSTDGGGGSPICHPTIKTCVECAADANCPMTQPFCDMDEYECVQCRTAADCQAGQTCNNQGNCSTISDAGRGGGG